MPGVWDSYDDAPFEQQDWQGLQRLKMEIESSGSTGRRWRKIMQPCAFALLAAALFFAGWVVSDKCSVPLKEVTLITSEGSVGDYTLPDGSRVRLNSESRLTFYDNLEGDTRLVDLEGEAFFEVSKDPSRPFTIRLNNLDVKVLGTSFDVMSYPGVAEDRIILKTGCVEVSDHNGDHLLMNPGEMVSYNRYDGTFSQKKVDADNICRWYEPFLDFDSATLEDVLFNISDRYRVTIDFETTACSLDSRMSMCIEREPLDKVLDVLCKLFPVRYEVHPDNHILIVDKSKQKQ